MLTQIKVKDFTKIYSIMEESFPFDEIRGYEEQQKLLSHPNYKILAVGDVDDLLGFIAVWEFENFVFLEHFAVSSKHRNKGLGNKILTQLQNYVEKKIILEVEYPENVESKRRIEFYNRNGFQVFDFDYIMPAYSKEHKEVPLLLMSNQTIVQENFDDFYDKISNIVNNENRRILWKN